MVAQGSNWLWRSSPESRVFTLKVKCSSIHLLLHSQKACTWTHEAFNWALAGLKEAGLGYSSGGQWWPEMLTFKVRLQEIEWSQHPCLSFLICKMGLAVGYCEKDWGSGMYRVGLNRGPRGHDYGGAAAFTPCTFPPKPWASTRALLSDSCLPFPLISSQLIALHLPSQPHSHQRWWWSLSMVSLLNYFLKIQLKIFFTATFLKINFSVFLRFCSHIRHYRVMSRIPHAIW